MKLIERKEAKKRIVINEIGLFIQSVLIICAIELGIISLFENTFAIVLEFVLSFALFTMAYNNSKVFKRGLFTIVYIIGGLICLIPALIKLVEMF